MPTLGAFPLDRCCGGGRPSADRPGEAAARAEERAQKLADAMDRDPTAPEESILQGI